MSQVVGRPETTAALLAALYGPVQAEMVEVEEMLRRELRWDPLESTCRHASLSIL